MGLSSPIFYKIISEVNINLGVDGGRNPQTGFDPKILVLKINYIFNHYNRYFLKV